MVDKGVPQGSISGLLILQSSANIYAEYISGNIQQFNKHSTKNRYEWIYDVPTTNFLYLSSFNPDHYSYVLSRISPSETTLRGEGERYLYRAIS